MILRVHAVVFGVVISCGDVVGHQLFGGPCCRLVPYFITLCHNPEDHDLNFHRRGNLKCRMYLRLSCGYFQSRSKGNQPDRAYV
jgi:hypothetical protein